MSLLSVHLPCAKAECLPLFLCLFFCSCVFSSILVSFFFSPLIHVSDSRRGKLKRVQAIAAGAAAHSTWHETFLGFTDFHWLLFLWTAGAASCFWIEHTPFMAPLLVPSITLWPVEVRSKGWGWHRPGLQSHQAVTHYFVCCHPMQIK